MSNYKTPPKRLAWRPKEVAQMLGLSLSQIRNNIRKGKFEVIRDGRAILIPQRSVDNFIGMEKNTDKNNHIEKNSSDSNKK